MENDHLYKRSLGQRYDPERLHVEVENGLAGHDGLLDRVNGFEQTPSDLFIETAVPDENGFRLQEIEYELSELLSEKEPSVETIERLLLLEAEKVVRLEAEVEALLHDNPLRGQALRDLFMTQLMDRAEAGQPVDAEMFHESDALAQTIIEQHPELDAHGLLEVAQRMEALIMAQLTLERHIDTSDELAFAS
jgi:hypothetical protein